MLANLTFANTFADLVNSHNQLVMAQVTGTCNVAFGINVTGNTLLTGNVTMSGNYLDVGGFVNIASFVVVAGNVTVAGIAEFDGPVIIDGGYLNISVDNGVYFNTGINVGGGTLDVGGFANLAGNLIVSGVTISLANGGGNVIIGQAVEANLYVTGTSNLHNLRVQEGGIGPFAPVYPVFANVSANIGGAALTTGQSNTANVAFTNLNVDPSWFVATCNPLVDPGANVIWQCFVAGGPGGNAGIVTVRVTALVNTTPVSTPYNVVLRQFTDVVQV